MNICAVDHVAALHMSARAPVHRKAMVAPFLCVECGLAGTWSWWLPHVQVIYIQCTVLFATPDLGRGFICCGWADATSSCLEVQKGFVKWMLYTLAFITLSMCSGHSAVACGLVKNEGNLIERLIGNNDTALGRTFVCECSSTALCICRDVMLMGSW